MISGLSIQHTKEGVTTGMSENVKSAMMIQERAQQQALQVNKLPEEASNFHSLSPHNEQLSSSSSLSNTDSDSLRSLHQNALNLKGTSGRLPSNNDSQYDGSSNSSNNNNNNNNSLVPSKSPILVKYNYYDYNGARREQENHNMNFSNMQSTNYHDAPSAHYNQQQQQHTYQVGKITRHLSPTFKQSLDQIVKNSQQLVIQQQQQQSGGGGSGNASNVSSPPSSPEQQLLAVQLARRYKLSSYEQRCLRCNKTVYQMDKVGPLKDFTFYHQNCFKCFECGTKLTLKTYFNNQQHSNDQEVYCHRHCPKTGPGRLDNQSVGIRAALNAPKVFDGTHQVVGGPGLLSESNCLSPQTGDFDEAGFSPGVDSRALHIQHAVQQTRLHNIYKKVPIPPLPAGSVVVSAAEQQSKEREKQQQVLLSNRDKNKKLSQLINKRLEFLEPKQKLLELRHREEEDALFKAFELKWRQEESFISEQIREEWQVELGKLLEKYKRQLSSISASNQQPTGKLTSAASAGNRLQQTEEDRRLKRKTAAAAAATVSNSTSEIATSGKQQMIELERMNLEKTMTIKLDRKKETLKRKLKEFERQATAELVEKQSKEMLTLISMKLNEYKEEQKRKIGSDLEQFEAIDTLANQLGPSLQLVNYTGNSILEQSHLLQQQPQQQVGLSQQSRFAQQTTLSCNAELQLQQQHKSLMEVPPPKAPKISKMEIYNNEEPDQVFKDIDQIAINVAREDQHTFTDLVHHLTRQCITDVEKVRAIFRWITVKNLNTMQFDSSVKPDTPLGLLRGIKNGSESYHVLFKRLCSYAGLHCVVIKGYSKSAGYQPGVKFECNKFRNSWNAVFVAGAWRFVQCNWGARHLVSVAVMQDKNNGKVAAKELESIPAQLALQSHAVPSIKAGRSHQHQHHHQRHQHHQHHHHQQQQHPHYDLSPPNYGRRKQVIQSIVDITENNNNNNNGLSSSLSPVDGTQFEVVKATNRHHHLHHHHQHHQQQQQQQPSPGRYNQSSSSPALSSDFSSTCSSPSNGSSSAASRGRKNSSVDSGGVRNSEQYSKSNGNSRGNSSVKSSNDSLRYEYDDHYFLTDPNEFIYEFHPLSPEWQLIKTRPITLAEFEQLPFVRSLFFKYGLYFPQHDIRSVLYTDSSGATTIKIGMPTHMIPSLIFHYNLKYYDSDLEHHEGVSLKRFVMQSIESGACDGFGAQSLLSNIVSFRVHLPETGAYILDIFANSTTPTQYVTGEPMKFKSVCKFKIVAKNLKTVMIPLPDCASGEFGPMKATRLFGIIPLTHENALIVVQNEKRFLEIQFRMTRPLMDFTASLHNNGYDERQLSKSIKIFTDGDIVFVTIKFPEDGQYGLDLYTRDQYVPVSPPSFSSSSLSSPVDAHHHNNNTQASYYDSRDLQMAHDSPHLLEKPKKQLLTHCCKYLINVRTQNTKH